MDLKNVIKVYLKKIALLETLKPIVKKWDGKTWTKRFETLMDKELNGQVSITYSRYGEIEFYASNPKGEWRCVYGDTCLIAIYSSDWDECINSENRLVAEKLIEVIDKQIKEYNEMIADMEKDLGKEDEIIAKYNSLVDELETFTKNISYELKNQRKNDFKHIIYKVN